MFFHPVRCDGLPGPLVVGIVVITVAYNQFVRLGMHSETLVQLPISQLFHTLNKLPGPVDPVRLTPSDRDLILRICLQTPLAAGEPALSVQHE